ncbi:MAG: glycosyltransferase family 1 protein [Desulfosporosinus sp.]|nr:glycosyltransferase family 1 protein [Desulfosporosinus sp.]
MHITIDCRFIHASGIGRYVREITNVLIKDTSHRFTLLTYKEDANFLGDAIRPNIEVVNVEGKMYSVREQIRVPFKIPNCDIFWAPHYNIPILPIKAKRRVVTIHDVNHLVYSSTLRIPQKIYAKCLMYFATRLSNLIITDSNFSKEEIVKYTGESVSKIKTIHCGFDRVKFRHLNLTAEERALISAKYSLPTNFILHVGNVKPHKNIPRMLQAFAKLQRKLQDSHLVILGRRDNFIIGLPDLSILIEKLGIGDKVHFTGFVADEHLPDIYNMAKLLVFPSLYEGFGFPPLEAMACGCPVVLSCVASMPEICGDAAFYIDPYDIDGIAEGMYEIYSNESLREKFITKGYEQVKLFSWENTAQEVMETLKRVFDES